MTRSSPTYHPAVLAAEWVTEIWNDGWHPTGRPCSPGVLPNGIASTRRSPCSMVIFHQHRRVLELSLLYIEGRALSRSDPRRPIWLTGATLNRQSICSTKLRMMERSKLKPAR